MVEFSPATREARVRFPASAFHLAKTSNSWIFFFIHVIYLPANCKLGLRSQDVVKD